MVDFKDTGGVAEWTELSPRSQEVADSSPGRAKPKALKLVLVSSQTLSIKMIYMGPSG